MRKYLALLVALGLPLSVLAQTNRIPVRLHADAGAQQTVLVSQLLGERFAVRLLHADDDTPIADVPLIFQVNFRFCIPLHPTCTTPPTEMYGQFQGSSQVVTDQDGRAIAPPFRAGSVPGSYEVYATLKQPHYFAGGPLDLSAFFSVQQFAGAAEPTPVPGPGWLALALLALAVIATANSGRLRRPL